MLLQQGFTNAADGNRLRPLSAEQLGIWLLRRHYTNSLLSL